MREDIQVFVERLCDAAGFELDVAVEPSYNDSGDFRVVLSGPDRGMLLRGGGARSLVALAVHVRADDAERAPHHPRRARR